MAIYIVVITYFYSWYFNILFFKNLIIKRNIINKSQPKDLATGLEKSESFKKINNFFARIGSLGKKILFKTYFLKLENLVASNKEYKNSNLTAESFIGFKFFFPYCYFYFALF